MSVRPFGVAVFGCTGNAGRATSLFAIEFAKGRKVALVGRNESKVLALKQSVCKELGHPGTNVGIIVADATDEKSMLDMAAAADIVIACAGPYERYGEAAVRACIESGSHYVDITGEARWVNNMANKYGAAAEEKGISLLSFSGYDCMPAELAMFLAGQALENQGGGMASLDMVFQNQGGGFPKGTLNTILDMLDGKRSKDSKKSTKTKTPVVPRDFKPVHRSAMSVSKWLLPQWSSHTCQWTVQNFMASINTVVLSRAASDLKYEPFTMNDRLCPIPSNSTITSILTLWGLLPCIGYQLICMLGVLFMIPSFRAWFRQSAWFRQYSFGGRAHGSIACDARAISQDGSQHVDVHIACDGDAGIYTTGRFAASVAWSLVDAYSPKTDDIQARTVQSNKVLTGFHSPVTAFHKAPGFLTNLQTHGVDMQVMRTVKGDAGSSTPVVISKL